MKGKLINIKHAVDEGFLEDWYINSVDPNDDPQWTESHIKELVEDFYIIPKESIITGTPIEYLNFFLYF